VKILHRSVIAGLEWRPAITGTIVGLLYGSILTILSLFAAGAGHGTSIPLWRSSAPFGAFGLITWRVVPSGVVDSVMLLSPLLVWAALGSLAALPKRLGFTQVLLLLQYACGLTLVVKTGIGLADLVRDRWVTIYVVAWAAVYVVGQVALWRRILKRI
jgi:hypothetical protein